VAFKDVALLGNMTQITLIWPVIQQDILNGCKEHKVWKKWPIDEQLEN